MDGARESYRYPGSRPFQDSELDRKLFWGRAREAHTLLHLTLAEKLVVFFAKSGLGKSSLLNAGVLSSLRERNYLPMVVRVNDPESGPLCTVFKDVEQTFHRDGVELATVPGGRLETRFGLRLDGPPPAMGEIAERCHRKRIPLWLFFKEVELWHGDVLLEPVLIFDQFEELFTLQTPEGRAELIDELACLVRGRLPQEAVDAAGAGGGPVDDAELRPPALKVLLSLREDWLGSLEELAPKIPGILSSRYRLEPLRKDAAREAIVRPAELDDPELGAAGFRYEPEAIDAILDYLSRRRVRGEMVPSDEIEPSQLQIVCQHVEEVVRRPGHAPVVTLADLGGGPERVSVVLGAVLEKYYDDQTAKAATWWRRRAVRRLCETGLIIDGRRASVDRAILRQRFGVTAEELSRLTDAHLLRAVPRLDSVQYELAHDTLVRPVMAARDKRRQHTRTVAGAVAVVVSLALALASVPKWREAAESRAQKRQESILESLHAVPEAERLADPPAFLIRALDDVERARRLSPAGTVPAGMEPIYRQAVAEAREIGRSPGGTLEAARRASVCAGAANALCDADGRADVPELLAAVAPEDVRAAAFVRLPGSGIRAVVTDPLQGMWIRQASGEVQPVPGSPGPITVLAVDPGGRRIATAGFDGTLRLWDVGADRPLGRPWRAHPRGGMAAAFDPAGRRLASGGSDGVVRIWDLEGEEPALARELSGHERDVRALAWRPDGLAIASGGRDAKVRIWDLGSGGSRELPGHTRPVRALAFDVAGCRAGACRLASAGSDGTLRVWDVEGDGALLHDFYDDEGEEDRGGRSIAWSPDGRRIASGGSDNALRVWTLDDAGEQPLRIPDAHDGSALAVAFHPESGELASAGRDSVVRIWRRRGSSYEQVHAIDGFQRFVNALGLTDGGLLVAASFGGTVKTARGDLARPEVRELHAGFQHFLSAVTLAADGTRLASGGTDGAVRLWSWDAASGQLRRLPHPIEPPDDEVWGAVEALAFSPDAERIAAGTADGTLRVWSDEGTLVAGPLHGHSGRVVAVDFEDGETLVSRGEDGTLRRWDVTPAAAAPATAAELVRWRPADDWFGVPCRRLASHPLLRGDDEPPARVRALCSDLQD
jgi:WD40 repeat protein